MIKYLALRNKLWIWISIKYFDGIEHCSNYFNDNDYEDLLDHVYYMISSAIYMCNQIFQLQFSCMHYSVKSNKQKIQINQWFNFRRYHIITIWNGFIICTCNNELVGFYTQWNLTDTNLFQISRFFHILYVLLSLNIF